MGNNRSIEIRSSTSGQAYLSSIKAEYHDYCQVLARLNDQAADYQQRVNAKRGMGLGSFMADFALERDEHRRNLKRWIHGTKLPTPTREMSSIIRSILPPFVAVDNEAIGGMWVERARTYEIDIVVEDIMCEIAKRLPRTLNAYQYHQNYASDKLQVPGLGTLDIRLSQSGDGIFSTISFVSNENFTLSNSRQSGVKYLDRLNDLSRLHEVCIKPKDIKFSLCADRTGIATREPARFEKLQEAAIVWLAENVLFPLRKMQLPEKQADLPPMEEPFPVDKVGPLYAFIKKVDVEKIVILKVKGIGNAFPDERTATSPNLRLCPPSINCGDAPDEVYDTYTWCGVGPIDEHINFNNLRIGNTKMDTWRGFSQEALAEISPLTATDIYIVDWQKWDDPGIDTNRFRSMGNTFVPITQYKGNYKTPVVLIGRNLEINEIGNIYVPPEEP